MKFTIERAALLKVVAHVSRVVERRNTYPILANVLITAADGQITLRATDLDIEITESAQAIIDAPGKTTVPAGTLHEIVRKAAEGALTFTLGENDIVIKSGRSRFSLNILSPESFPDLKVGTFTHEFTMPAADLARIIAKTAFAISTEETRYYLNGIFLHVDEDEKRMPVLRGVATDGHRMARCECPAPDGSNGMPGIIVPRKAVGEISKLLDAGGDIKVEVSDTKIRIAIGGVSLLSKLIEGTFPDYKRVTPALSNTVASVKVSDLRAAIDRVSVISSDRGGKAVKFKLETGKLEISVTNPDHGDSVEDMDAIWEAEPFEIGFNARYANDILGIVSGKQVSISVSEPGSPTRLFAEDDPSTLFVLMPMRI